MKDYDVSEIKNIITHIKAVKNHIQGESERLEAKVQELDKELQDVEKAQAFIQKVAQDTQSKLKFHIEDIVNLALDTVFPNEYLFKVEFVIMRGKTEANLVFIDRASGREIDPMISNGGGALDLACFALRLACHTLEKECDDVIIADEPFKFMSKDLRERGGQLLRELSKKLGLQIIMVTHIEEFIDIADKVIEVKKKDGVSYVEER